MVEGLPFDTTPYELEVRHLELVMSSTSSILNFSGTFRPNSEQLSLGGVCVSLALRLAMSWIRIFCTMIRCVSDILT